MNDTYTAGCDVYMKDGKPHLTVAIFNNRTQEFVVLAKKQWKARLWLLVCRLVGIRVMKETNR